MHWRRGYSFRELGALVGWDFSGLRKSACKMLKALKEYFVPFFLAFPTFDQQRSTCTAFGALGFVNFLSDEGHNIEVFAAVDCFYYMIPKATGISELDEDESVYYTGYKKIHGVKLSVMCCVLSGLILDVSMSPASISDPDVFEVFQLPRLEPSANVFGDKAYSGIPNVVSPVKEGAMGFIRLAAKCGAALADLQLAQAEEHNSVVHRFRSSVECAIGEMSEWACVKGSQSFRMVEQLVNLKDYADVIAALCNFSRRSRDKMAYRNRDSSWLEPVLKRARNF
jgi:hypothetical protein